MKSIADRLAALEERYKRDPMMVLCPDGEVRSVREVVAAGMGWCRVVAGSDLDDLGLLLDELKRRAEEDTRGCGDD